MPRSKIEARAEEELVSEIFNDLTSIGIVEQLRHECIADVKTKATYRQLKDRIKAFVADKISKKIWTSEDSFREQVVECSVIALTVEQIVDVVVTRKLEECIRPLLKELVLECVKNRRVSDRNSLSPSSEFRVPNAGLQQTTNAVQKISEDTKRDCKKIFGTGLVALSIASASQINVLAPEDRANYTTGKKRRSKNDNSVEDSPKYQRSPILDTPEASPQIRSGREIRPNPKYSSDLFHTSLPVLSPGVKRELKKLEEQEPLKKVKVEANGEDEHKPHFSRGGVLKPSASYKKFSPKKNQVSQQDKPQTTFQNNLSNELTKASQCKVSIEHTPLHQAGLGKRYKVETKEPVTSILNSTKRYEVSDLYKPHNPRNKRVS